jgi:hypothetical protein
LKWEPSVSLEEGLAVTYAWIADQVKQQGLPNQAEPAQTA